MKSDKKPSVLVCVTGQYDCDRLIREGYNTAVEQNLELHVLMVHKPISDYAFLGAEAEYLYRVTKELGSDMTLMFSDNPAQTAVDYAKSIHAKQLVTGMSDGSPNNFVYTVSTLAPHLPIKMVSKDNIVYTYDVKFV
ncbi:MAG: hypothetical protein ACI4IS_03940 [Acutalibacteraceae bacterium]